MAESHVVSALVAKRAEISGIIARIEQQLGQLRANLIHLDATIRLFAPDMEPKAIPARRIHQPDRWFEQGELPRRVLDAVRRAGVPIRAPDIVRAVMIDKGLDPSDRQSVARVQWKVRDTLTRLSKRDCLCRRVPAMASFGGSPITRLDAVPPSGSGNDAASIRSMGGLSDGPEPSGRTR